MLEDWENKDLVGVPSLTYNLRNISFDVMTIEEFGIKDEHFCFDISKINEMNNLSLIEKIEFYLNAMEISTLYLTFFRYMELTTKISDNRNTKAKRPITFEEFKNIPEDDFKTNDEKYLLKKYFGC